MFKPLPPAASYNLDLRVSAIEADLARQQFTAAREYDRNLRLLLRAYRAPRPSVTR